MRRPYTKRRCAQGPVPPRNALQCRGTSAVECCALACPPTSTPPAYIQTWIATPVDVVTGAGLLISHCPTTLRLAAAIPLPSAGNPFKRTACGWEQRFVCGGSAESGQTRQTRRVAGPLIWPPGDCWDVCLKPGAPHHCCPAPHPQNKNTREAAAQRRKGSRHNNGREMWHPLSDGSDEEAYRRHGPSSQPWLVPRAADARCISTTQRDSVR